MATMFGGEENQDNSIDKTRGDENNTDHGQPMLTVQDDIIKDINFMEFELHNISSDQLCQPMNSGVVVPAMMKESVQETVFRQELLFTKIFSYLTRSEIKSARLVNWKWNLNSERFFYASKTWLKLPSPGDKWNPKPNCDSDMSAYLDWYSSIGKLRSPRVIMDITNITAFFKRTPYQRKLLDFLAQSEDSMTHLHLCMIISDKGAAALKFLKALLSNCPTSLTSVWIDFQKWSFKQTASVIFRGIAPQITQLEIRIRQCSNDADGVLQLLEILLAFPNVEYLQLDCCCYKHGEAFLTNIASCSPTGLSKLQGLNLKMGYSDATFILTKLLLLTVPLTKLVLGMGSAIGHDGDGSNWSVCLNEVFEKFCPHLEELEITMSDYCGTLPPSPKLKYLKLHSHFSYSQQLKPKLNLDKIINSGPTKFQADFPALQKLEISIFFGTRTPQQLRNLLMLYDSGNCSAFPKYKKITVNASMEVSDAEKHQLKTEFRDVEFLEYGRIW